jgi:hypothetical protein
LAITRHPDQHLAAIGAAQEADEGARCRLDAVDYILAVADLAAF